MNAPKVPAGTGHRLCPLMTSRCLLKVRQEVPCPFTERSEDASRESTGVLARTEAGWRVGPPPLATRAGRRRSRRAVADRGLRLHRVGRAAIHRTADERNLDDDHDHHRGSGHDLDDPRDAHDADDNVPIDYDDHVDHVDVGPGAGPPFVELAARADCYFGFPVVRIDATALQETFGGGVNLYRDDSLQRQADVPALADGESWNRILPAPRSGTVMLEVYFYGGPGGPIDDRWVGIEMAACPPPPTAPTFTTTVEGCAGDDEGATIEVTVTNTPGGPEYGFQINYSIPGSMQGDDYWAALVDVNPADGQQAVAVLEFDEIEVDGVIRQQDPGGYPVWLSWQVDIPGDPFPQRLETEHAEVTVPACEPYLSAPVRVATFNASLNRTAERELVADLSTSSMMRRPQRWPRSSNAPDRMWCC